MEIERQMGEEGGGWRGEGDGRREEGYGRRGREELAADPRFGYEKEHAEDEELELESLDVVLCRGRGG